MLTDVAEVMRESTFSQACVFLHMLPNSDRYLQHPLQLKMKNFECFELATGQLKTVSLKCLSNSGIACVGKTFSSSHPQTSVFTSVIR